MAISKIRTYLPLDEYARIMSIPGWHFNQVNYPARPVRGACDMFWLQSGYLGDPNRIVGRDDVAQAIATAEGKLADYLGFHVAPGWFCEEEHVWPRVKRGIQLLAPRFHTRWGYLQSAGLEAWDLLTVLPTPIVYSASIADGTLDTATITFDTYLTVDNPCEIAVVPPGRDPTLREWRIRPLDVTLDGGVITLTGPRWMFVDPDVWLDINEVQLDDPFYFLNTVDLYRHYNDTTSMQGQVKWQGTNLTFPCVEVCQSACVTRKNIRIGEFIVSPAMYSASSAGWVAASWASCEIPSHVLIWYYAGYVDQLCYGCETMSDRLKEAIVRLANVYLLEAPCGCGLTRERWQKDREEMPMINYDVALAQSAFGTTARGAVFARSVAATLPPLGQGG